MSVGCGFVTINIINNIILTNEVCVKLFLSNPQNRLAPPTGINYNHFDYGLFSFFAHPATQGAEQTNI